MNPEGMDDDGAMSTIIRNYGTKQCDHKTDQNYSL